MHTLNAVEDGINRELAEVADDVLHTYCKRQRVTREVVADWLGYNPTTFSNYLMGARFLPAAAVVRISNRCGLGLIQELCRQCGGMFIATPRGTEIGTGAAAYKAAVDFMKTAGNGASLCFKVLEDGKITHAEHDQVKRWLSKLAEAVNVLQRAFDEMPKTREIDAEDADHA